VVIVDNRMPPTWTAEGLETAREVRRRFPSVGVLVLSASVEADDAVELLCGVDRVGYLLKSQVTEVGQLADAVEQIALGSSVIDPTLVRELLAAYGNGDPLTRLTSGERNVLAVMAQGRSDLRIAQILGITKEEASRRAHSVLTKLCLPESSSDHHRALAVLAFLEAR
jgi:DNA-binding NarL/FixJ family response regulator